MERLGQVSTGTFNKGRIANRGQHGVILKRYPFHPFLKNYMMSSTIVARRLP